MTTIIIIKYNNEEVEIPCLESVIKHTREPHHLIVFDNYPRNQNLSYLWNKIIRETDSEYVCLLNSDTIVSEGWLTKLVEVFKKEKKVGAVGPTTDNCKNHQNTCPVSDKYEVVSFAEEYPNECLSGFCLVLDRDLVLDVGGFPEDCGFYGQEVIMLDKITSRGANQYWRKDVFVHHIGSSSVKKAEQLGEIDEQKERIISRKLINDFREKEKSVSKKLINKFKRIL